MVPCERIARVLRYPSEISAPLTMIGSYQFPPHIAVPESQGLRIRFTARWNSKLLSLPLPLICRARLLITAKPVGDYPSRIALYSTVHYVPSPPIHALLRRAKRSGYLCRITSNCNEPSSWLPTCRALRMHLGHRANLPPKLRRTLRASPLHRATL